MGNNRRRPRNKKISRRERFLIKQKKRRKLAVLIIALLIALTAFTAKKVFAYVKCQDISTAVEYLMTSNVDNALLRVQTMELKFSDGETAVVEASGLSKEKPRQSRKVECHLKKKNNSWKLENSYILK